MKLNGLRQFGKELAAIGRNKKVLIPVIAVLTVPVMYTAMFLGAFWDPYARMEELPVAVVNSDAGTEFQGELLRIGDDFEEKLKENRKFDWHFVTMEEAVQGMKDNKYYMAIQIPEDFSQQTTTLTSERPEAARLVFLPNEGYNFLASQIGNTAVEQMKAALNKEVTEAYTHTVFDKLEQAADGIVQAAAGAGLIADGTAKATDGAQLLKQNLGKLTNGTTALQDGATKLNAAGAQLADGSGALHDGSVKLSGGLEQLAAAGGGLAAGAADAEAGASELADGMAASLQSTAQLREGAQGLAAGLEQLAAGNPELAASDSFRSLLAVGRQLESGLAQSAAGQERLQAGAGKLAQGVRELAAGAGMLETKLNETNNGAAELTAGLERLKQGSAELADGLAQLNGSIGTLTSGARQLESGATELGDGLLELENGTRELSSKLADASAQTGGLALTDDAASMFAEPVRLDVAPSTVVPNYGTGFAPYFLSLGLYVGALLITIVYTLREPAVRPANGWSWFWSKALTLMLIGAVQALIADAALILLLKLEVQNMPLFILFSMMTSIAFMMLIQFLVTTLGHPGRFAAIVLLILQLTSSAGTFPLELIPVWLQHVTPWLPMTYSVAGLKDVISSGEVGRMWSDAALLGGYAVLFGFLTLAYFTFSHRRERSGSAETNGELTTA